MLIPVESQLHSNYDDHNNLQLERNLQVLHARIHPTIRHLLCQIDITDRVLTPQTATSSSQSTPRSNLSSARFPQLKYQAPSFYSSYDSLYAASQPDISTIGYNSENVRPQRNALHMSLETLLDTGSSKRKVTIRRSKYNEIGNPHARKRKEQKKSPIAVKKWNRNASIASHGLSQDLVRKEKLNFMDKQSNSIYNSYEKAKIDLTLRPKKPYRVPKIAPLPALHAFPAANGDMVPSHNAMSATHNSYQLHG